MIERAGDFNILVMLDSHRLNDQEIPELWYNNEFPEETMLEAWDTVLGDTKHHWNRTFVCLSVLGSFMEAGREH